MDVTLSKSLSAERRERRGIGRLVGVGLISLRLWSVQPAQTWCAKRWWRCCLYCHDSGFRLVHWGDGRHRLCSCDNANRRDFLFCFAYHASCYASSLPLNLIKCFPWRLQGLQDILYWTQSYPGDILGSEFRVAIATFFSWHTIGCIFRVLSEIDMGNRAAGSGGGGKCSVIRPAVPTLVATVTNLDVECFPPTN